MHKWNLSYNNQMAKRVFINLTHFLDKWACGHGFIYLLNYVGGKVEDGMLTIYNKLTRQ